MSLRARFTEELKAAMLARDAARVSALRLITSKLKDTDIAARPGPPVADDAIVSMLRGMAKSRRESIELYEKGNRADLVAKEQAEIDVIEAFLPATLDAAALTAAVAAAIAATGAASMKDMGRVMAALKATHGAALDPAAAGAVVKAALAG
jgi:uncharacterized protein YqeY